VLGSVGGALGQVIINAPTPTHAPLPPAPPAKEKVKEPPTPVSLGGGSPVPTILPVPAKDKPAAAAAAASSSSAEKLGPAALKDDEKEWDRSSVLSLVDGQPRPMGLDTLAAGIVTPPPQPPLKEDVPSLSSSKAVEKGVEKEKMLQEPEYEGLELLEVCVPWNGPSTEDVSAFVSLFFFSFLEACINFPTTGPVQDDNHKHQTLQAPPHPHFETLL
jgi:hypothetical protein